MDGPSSFNLHQAPTQHLPELDFAALKVYSNHILIGNQLNQMPWFILIQRRFGRRTNATVESIVMFDNQWYFCLCVEEEETIFEDRFFEAISL
jgi:hypothetical protein